LFSNPDTKKVRAGRLIVAAFILVLLVRAAWPAELPLDYIQPLDAGEINWRTGKIAATGFSEPAKKKSKGSAAQNEALSAARKIAVETLARLVGNLRLSGERTVADTMAAESSIAEKVGEMVRAAPVVQQNFRSDGAVEVVVEMSIHGGFAQLILPEDIRPIEAIQPVGNTKNEPRTAVKDPAKMSRAGGLVIDARGLGVVPAMMFAVLDENGKAVYGSAYVSREYAVQWGMAAYVRRLPTGPDFARVTPRPLVIKGLRAVGPRKTDIVISNADAIKLKGAVENLILLRQGRVAVILD
jgi:hypothetical protein